MKSIGLKIALLIAMVIICLLAYKVWKQPPPVVTITQKHSDVIDEAQTEAKKMAEVVDAKGFSKAIFEGTQAIAGNGDLSKLPVSQSVLDSLRLDNLQKGQKLEQASAINATLKASGLRAIKEIDSLKRLYYIYTDDFATAKFTPDSLGGKFDLNYKIKLIQQDYKKRSWFLSPYKHYTDILSPDKRITINGLQKLTITSDNPTRFGIGLQAGYHYVPQMQQLTPTFGIGISYNLIRF